MHKGPEPKGSLSSFASAVHESPGYPSLDTRSKFRFEPWWYHHASIGNDFIFSHTVRFETAILRRLYQYGYDRSVKGIAWKKSLPNRME